MPRVFLRLSLMGLVFGCVFVAGCPGTNREIPVPNFSVSANNGTVPCTLQFTDTSQPGSTPIRAWAWEFGDGTRSTRRNPVKTYTIAGTFTVSLTVTTAQGNFTRTAEKYIEIKDPTTFGSLDQHGGSVTANGVTITVPDGVLKRETAFGVNESSTDVTVPATESTVRISRNYFIGHDNDTPDLYLIGDDGKVVPTIMRIPILSGGLSPNAAELGQIFLLAQFEDGHTLPIPAKLDGDSVIVKVMRLPFHASYTVVYQPESQTFRAIDYVPAKAADDMLRIWPETWKVSASVEMIRQMTALRLGNINNEFSFGRRDFTEEQLGQTGIGLLIGVQSIHDDLAASDMRHPALIEDENSYSMLIHNMQALYPSNYASFSSLVYRDDFFGQIVVDPGQLLAISIHNAAAYKADPKNEDIAQVFNSPTAFVEALFQSIYKAYNLPNIATTGDPRFGIPPPADRDAEGNVLPVNFAAGFQQGGGTYLGQDVDGQTARSFEENQYSLLSMPLLFPYSTKIGGYAQSGQEFYFYIGNDPASYKSPEDLIGGTLEGLRIAFDETTTKVQFLEALGLSYKVMDEVLDNELAKYYWDFARDRAYENSQVSMLRPSDHNLAPFSLNVDRFDPDAVVGVQLDAPSSKAELLPNNYPALKDILPLSTRAVLIETAPMTTEMSISFNPDSWEADDDGNTMAVKVYRVGSDGIELSQPAGIYGNFEIVDADADGKNDTVIARMLRNPADDCGVQLLVLASNLSLTGPNSLKMTVQGASILDIPETQVLRAYMQACDPTYGYKVRNTIAVPSQGVTSYVLEMTSGVWRSSDEVDAPTWKHFITIVEPTNVTSSTGMLVVSGGSTGSEPSVSLGQLLLPFAKSTGSVVAIIQAVPNQPLLFAGDTDTRSEDEIIARSYSKYMDSWTDGSPDMTWPALLPMTRSAVRAMDAIQDFMATKPSGSRMVSDFMITGASKRGWTTWLTAAVDPRISAAVPIVIDVLNMQQQMVHQKQAYRNYPENDEANSIYGGYSMSVGDYVLEQVFQRFGTPPADSLLSIVDPLKYKNILQMPKLIANSTGDQFFLPDSSKFYWDQLTGEKYLHYAPNTDHSLTTTGLDKIDTGTLNTIMAFYIAHVRNTNANITDDVRVPKYSWEPWTNQYSPDEVAAGKARIVVTSEDPPMSVKLWQATNTGHRDFRLEIIGAAWTSKPVLSQCEIACQASANPLACTCDPLALNQVFVGEVDIPKVSEVWTGFMVELTYPGPDPNQKDVNYVFTTPVRVIPDVYPAK